MKLTCIADTHGDYFMLPPFYKGDVLIHAGDVTLGWGYDFELKAFNEWIGNQPFKYKIVIAGNHDAAFANHTKEELKNILTNCIYLENDYVEIEGKIFYGSPITPEFNNWYYMAKRGNEIKKYWDMIPADTDVLITHGPPYGILDVITDINGKPLNHIGCQDLKNKFEQEIIIPKLCVFGHVHESYGIKSCPQFLNKPIFINCSLMDRNYNVTNKPIEIEI